jgi:iron(III) transport system permease protein
VAPALGVVLIWGFLAVFLLYPLARIFYDAVTDDAGAFTLGHFQAFFTDPFYLRSLWNSLLLGAGVVIASSVLGIGIAFLLVRYDFWGRHFFSYLTLIPIISPPLVGVLGFVFILGRAGTVNVLLMDYLDLVQPLNFMYGLHGVLLVETLHLFPMITLNVVDALGKVDPALEEAAESVGARGWRKLWTITLPLTTPGYVAGALLVFIWTFADFVTPLVVGVTTSWPPRPTSTSCSSWTGVSSEWASSSRRFWSCSRWPSCSWRGTTWRSRTTLRSRTRG